MSLRISFLTFTLLIAGCPSDPMVCTPGASVACVGAGGCAGGQTCNADGSGFGPCDCGGGDAGGRDGGGTDVPASDVPGSDVPGLDAPVDGGPTDAPTAPCDPVAQTGCGMSERCVWLRVTAERGEMRCVANGTVAEGATCTDEMPGGATPDDCQRGLVCIDRACRRICDTTSPTACGTDTCVRYDGIFAPSGEISDVGACIRSCNPVTQLFGDGSACDAGQGCYWLRSATSNTFVCASAGTVAIGATITGTPFANSCVPGGMPLMRSDGTNYCGAFCTPVETHSGAPSGAVGMSPHTCPDRGVGPPSDCRFAWFTSMTSGDTRLDRVGLCLDPTDLRYDSNGDGTDDSPWPSCTTVPNTDGPDPDVLADHLFFGCGPEPRP